MRHRTVNRELLALHCQEKVMGSSLAAIQTTLKAITAIEDAGFAACKWYAVVSPLAAEESGSQNRYRGGDVHWAGILNNSRGSLDYPHQRSCLGKSWQNINKEASHPRSELLVDWVTLPVHANCLMKCPAETQLHGMQCLVVILNWSLPRGCLVVPPHERFRTKPDSFSFTATLSAQQAHLNFSTGKKSMHKRMLESCCGPDQWTLSALMNACAKSEECFHGCQEDVVKVYESIGTLSQLSSRLYEEMGECGLRPDKVTFIGLLMTCSHSGLVETGRLFCINELSLWAFPEMDHLACGWICFGREMGTQLGGDLKLLEPRNEMSYVLLSNLYCASGQWKEAEVVRKAMIDQGVKKMPGCSWIEVKNKVSIIAMVMGERGLMARIICPEFGGYLTFGTLESGIVSAPGQPTIDDLVNLNNFRQIGPDRNTKVFGIIGKPVGHSKSPILYNEAFKKVGFNGVYLHLLVDDVANFLRT
ncbi:hypothetical protein LOK49_LG06G03186 [Camellia lanceoleosa]|uniref:Uncharacterized protein n=1 Tax=Camellia lanceoleosa TaxID=1840588 RepID=A0ACC0HJG5_9ERIC|nr:hypothetical protein LOK49_LG06G03186 [Camellia lanceoleosa]